MKFNFKLSNIEVMDMKIGGIEIETEMSMGEVIGCRKEAEWYLEQLPVYLDQLAKGARKFMEIDEEFNISLNKPVRDLAEEIAKLSMEDKKETYEELVARKTAERKEYFANLDAEIKNKQNKE